MAGGANRCSLIEGQANFEALGACEQLFKSNVRGPTESDSRDPDWRRLDTERDRYLKWAAEDDHKLWQSVKGTDTFLYYWKPGYWLLQQAVRRGPGEK